ncbi:POU domain, class 6, transcription factor 1 isoform X2 [Diceros bicornis minor]|uniref:POU domain, class 6, transcription factor 1 isoform X2 n=1 Tax=Diceros bicornis minor TaxID=77932 RepID=UPI0026EDBFBC|nr:POU domain, class 6, transcription factor 1 isoform X2 [Diceros bicornis minor]
MGHMVAFSSRVSGWIQLLGSRSVLWEWLRAQAKCRGGLTQGFLTYRVSLILEWPNWKHFSAGGKELSAGCVSRGRRPGVLRRPGGHLHRWGVAAPLEVGACPEQMAQLEQRAHGVIVMSGHETIRVLEVGVDAQFPAEEEGKGLEGVATKGSQSRGPAKASEPAGEAGPDNPDSPAEATGKSLPGIPPSPAPAVATFSQAPSQPQASQTLTPLAVQAAPQVFTQENLATVLTGVVVPAGAVTQPLLIPISIAGQVAGQQGLAVWTIPTATVAALPGLTAASPTGAVFKPPLAGLQAAVLNTALPAPVQAAPPVQASSPAQPRPPAQPQTLFQTQPLLQTTPAILPQPTAATATAPTPKPVDTPSQITVQPAGFAFSPGIISAASLGGQTQILGSLTTTPVIANAIPSMPGISSQILTNAQGQVIGTLPWVVNSASVAAPAPAQSLQVQAVTPQLLLNAQGQVIATLASSPLPPPVAVRKPSTPETPAKSEVQPIQPTPAVPQPAVVIASPAPAAKPSASAPIPITCSETPTVSQLVSKPHTPSLDEDGINLEEIREFAKNFKIRRLSLGLTQTQVGQALTATEGPAYSQSAICRFEKLDITPKSAQKLKPVLEKWLNEAELRNQEGQQNLMEFVGGEPSKKRKRRTSFTPQAIEALNAYFEKNPLPTGQEITEIAKELNYDREVVRVWFCNRRQTLKNTSKLNVFQIP